MIMKSNQITDKEYLQKYTSTLANKMHKDFTDAFVNTIALLQVMSILTRINQYVNLKVGTVQRKYPNVIITHDQIYILIILIGLGVCGYTLNIYFTVFFNK